MRQRLTRHPETPCAAVTGIEAELSRPGAGQLEIRYRLAGEVSGLRLPAIAAPARRDELWRRTCFEAFVRPDPGETYYEFNLAPSRAWAAYRLGGYRQGMAAAAGIARPQIDVSPTSDGVELHARIDIEGARGLAEAAWRVGLSAVIEETSGAISYWALAHPPGRPDFHHADCFVLRVPAPGAP